MCFYNKNKTCEAAMSADGELRNWLQDFLQKTGQTRSIMEVFVCYSKDFGAFIWNELGKY